MTKKIAIWGSYHNGNFGDDLMAVMLAEHLVNHGYEPIVYRLDKELASQHRVAVTNSLEELLIGAACCVIGGGAFLVGDDLGNTFYAALLRDLDVLHQEISARRIPVIGVSLGGRGLDGGAGLPPQVARLFNNPLFLGASVRLPDDVKLLREFNGEHVYYPDIVLTSARLLSDTRRSEVAPTEILVQHHMSLKAAGLLYAGVAAARILGRRVRFVQTQLPQHGGRELGIAGMTSRYDSLSGILAELSSTRMIITSKLHVGVAAVALGKCFISLGGLPKTSAFLESIHRGGFRYSKESVTKLLRLMLSRSHAERIEKSFELNNLAVLVEAAEKHYDFMLNMLERIEFSDGR